MPAFDELRLDELFEETPFVTLFFPADLLSTDDLLTIFEDPPFDEFLEPLFEVSLPAADLFAPFEEELFEE